MRIEIFIFFITIFFMYNAYYDNKYIDFFKKNTKMIKVMLYGFIGLCLIVFIRKYPYHSKSLFGYANDLIKFVPIDKNSKDMLTPILDFTQSSYGIQNTSNTPQYNRMMNSGLPNNTSTNPNHSANSKRSVSETKKKFVASRQNWICAHCNQPLDYTYEVDHIVELRNGGSNHVDNLEALCRNCHGKKTFTHNL